MLPSKTQTGLVAYSSTSLAIVAKHVIFGVLPGRKLMGKTGILATGSIKMVNILIMEFGCVFNLSVCVYFCKFFVHIVFFYDKKVFLVRYCHLSFTSKLF